MLFFILDFQEPWKSPGKMVKQPWKTLDFWISEDVQTLKRKPRLYFSPEANLVKLIFYWINKQNKYALLIQKVLEFAQKGPGKVLEFHIQSAVATLQYNLPYCLYKKIHA